MPIRYKGIDILVQYAKGCLDILDTKDVGRAMSVPDIGGWKMIRRYYSGHGAPVAEQDQTTKIVETVICTIALGTLCQLLT
ncbi:unnamed protein product [Callosobruchus maculatus]|uniref:Uncharacterized protein n=1 Tax=Callosobruchus maculatus TaxID=64391 RepID=A0A653C7M6_CALMS|nr:unnamed protein product [Callosobruchus maculatus]